MRTLVLLLGIVGGAFIASPANSEGLPGWARSQSHYARILNPIAAQVMSWVDAQQVEDTQEIWLKSADLLQITPSHYRFELGVKQGEQLRQSINTIDFDFHAIEGQIPQEMVMEVNMSHYNQHANLYSHSAHMFVIDKDMLARALVHSGTPKNDVAADLRILIAEK